MILRDKIIFLCLAIALIFFGLYQIKSILAPFICGIIIAYFFNPIVEKFEEKQYSRTVISFLIILIFISFVTIFAILFLPFLYSQFLNLTNEFPKYFNIFLTDYAPKALALSEKYGIKINGNFKDYLEQADFVKILGFSNDILSNLISSSLSFVNILSLIFITPLVAFYLLRDWDLLVEKIDEFLPKKYSKDCRAIFLQIDQTLSAYIRGQLNVCLILGILYAIGLVAVGLNFGFVIGLITGLISFMPYIGMLIGVLIAFFVGLFQWGLSFADFGMVALVFLIGQIIESNFLTPNLIGEKIGIHPVWLIFSLFVFGLLFGFIGILVAVPTTSIIGVLVRNFAAKYKKKFT